ncbi:ABC transporter ATP-binding protein [Echinimonas agarilytica]|uniref:ABC transporter ATP-binding protein n=1 Tax=Echinimonas agarilytica TaxID=1215918 RepID=A0AA41W3D3_9GAMM|nr:ABC transporter ATP-binding protein [Echinimonas agarilytica]MCM2678105.1 ABC transporter ATP-binding protein [Echinimonas agarilytica]
MKNDAPHLLVNSLQLQLDGHRVLQQVSLELRQGEVNCLLGPSGCGKSTLLKTIAGLLQPCQGEIVMDGTQLSSALGVVAPEQRQIGMVFQDLALFPHMTVAQNICFGLHRQTATEQAQRLRQLLSLIGLEDKANEYPAALSGGQQQRVALARALAPKPKLLLMDEPFSGFDTHLKSVLVPELRQILKHEGITTLIVTHDQQEAFGLADRIAVMQQGTIHQYDAAQALYCKPATEFVATFIGRGILIAGEVQQGVIKTALGQVAPSSTQSFADGTLGQLLVREEMIQYDRNSSITLPVLSRAYCGHHLRYELQLEQQSRIFCHVPADLDVDDMLNSLPVSLISQQAVFFSHA